MKLKRLTLREFKRFTGEWIIDGLEPGLNVLVGPNEAGKSTVAAALRAVFLERYKTTAGAAADFAPTGLGQARPTVEVSFTLQGTDYRLTKTFLHRQRCELIVGDERLEGDQAEQRLAGLLGFELPKTGMSKPVHAGVPGLLWMTQGTGHDVAQPALHAGGHLRSALTALSGELAATDGDRLLDHVSAARAGLLDTRLGKPKGAYREAELALAQAREQCAGLRAAQTAWERDVDSWAALRHEHAADTQAEPWVALEKQAEQARMALSRVADCTEQAARAKAAAQYARHACDLLVQQISRDEADAAALAELARLHAQAELDIAEARERQQRAVQAYESVQVTAHRAAESLVQARAYAFHVQRQQQREAARRASTAVDEALAQARAKADQVQSLQTQSPGPRMSPGDLARLRDESAQLQGLRARAQALATRLRYDLTPSGQVRVAGVPIQGRGGVSLTAETPVEIEGAGVLTVTPGAGDAAQLQAEWTARAAAHRQVLAHWGADTLAQVEVQSSETERWASELKFARDALVLHAPDGIQALAARADDARRAWAVLAADPAAEPPQPTSLTQDAAESADVRARAALSQARDTWREAQSSCESAIARANALSEQQTARTQSLHSEAAVTERTARVNQLEPARQAVARLQGEARTARAALDALPPDLLAQDAQRWARSAKVARDSHDARAGQIHQLQGRIEQGGAQGIGESLAQADALEQRLARRVDDYAQRAAALTLLHDRLAAHRDRATRRLFAPLAKRLNHYLGLLFPQAGLVLDDDLTPRSLTRDGQPDAVATLSFGTQEQLGVLTRLAYADVLAEAGRPALLVLDDALVHTDDARREQMKRALFDAATRHQILMLTCHADAWRDMGVVQRRL